VGPAQEKFLKLLANEQTLEQMRNAVEVVGEQELVAMLREELCRRTLNEISIFRRFEIVVVSSAYVFGSAMAQWSMRRRTRRVTGLPGHTLSTLADFVYSPRTVERIFEATLADLQNEYCKALADGRAWKARWVRLRGYWGFWNAALAHLLVSVLDNVVKIWKLTR
jgi:hypothetical protein